MVEAAIVASAAVAALVLAVLCVALCCFFRKGGGDIQPAKQPESANAMPLFSTESMVVVGANVPSCDPEMIPPGMKYDSSNFPSVTGLTISTYDHPDDDQE